MRSILGAAIETEADVTLVDMEAGLEHLSRSGGTLAYADVLLVVMEPSRKSILTAGRTIILANELGLQRVYGVGNKARPGDEEFFAEVGRGRRYALNMQSTPLEQLDRFDCVLIATDHSAYDYERIVAEARLVVDSRNATRAIASEKIVRC